MIKRMNRTNCAPEVETASSGIRPIRGDTEFLPSSHRVLIFIFLLDTFSPEMTTLEECKVSRSRFLQKKKDIWYSCFFSFFINFFSHTCNFFYSFVKIFELQKYKFCILRGRHFFCLRREKRSRARPTNGNFPEIWGQPHCQVVRVNILSGRRSRLSKLSIGSSSSAVSTPHRRRRTFSSPFFRRTTTFLRPARVYSRSIDREYTSGSRERESFRATKIGGIVRYRRKRERLPHFATFKQTLLCLSVMLSDSVNQSRFSLFSEDNRSCRRRHYSNVEEVHAREKSGQNVCGEIHKWV